VGGKVKLDNDFDRPEIEKIILEIEEGPFKGFKDIDNIYVVILFRFKVSSNKQFKLESLIYSV
jgi:hypothetical protein